MKILGVKIDNVTMDEAVNCIVSMIEDGGKHYVVTPNAEFLVDAQRDCKFRDVLNNADLSIPDGMGLVYASKFYGAPLSERVAGTDLVDKLCASAAGEGWSVFFLGGRRGVGERAAGILQKKYPGLNICGFYEGKKEEGGDEETLGAIAEVSGSVPLDILFVAYGHPDQEKWIARNLEELEVSVAIGVGGAFDFVSGAVPRAPLWMRRVGLEWLFRLYQEPWRWRRIFKAVIVFPVLVIKDITNANGRK